MALFQSTRPRGARRHNFVNLASPFCVSIHAPAWGATKYLRCWNYHYIWFQSTRPRGARQSRFVTTRCGALFQSTRPRGARRLTRTMVKRRRMVSIHAPAWGATSAHRRHRDVRASFNPRARVGRDTTFPARWRRWWRFNPRARVGRDIAQDYGAAH